MNALLKLDKESRLVLSEKGASHFANLALKCVDQEYPNKLNQVLNNEKDLQGPKDLHPAFYGCFDWHSCVHGTWMLIRLLKEFPTLPEANEIRKKLRINLTKEHIAAEVAYFKSPGTKSWERMYGWSWLMKLAEEIHGWDDADGLQWRGNLKPLVEVIKDRYYEFLPKQAYPIRTGVHPNTAFGLSFAYDYAIKAKDQKFKTFLEKYTRKYFIHDENAPTTYEPSGEDFLSASLEEANLMRRVLSANEFKTWFKHFLPKKNIRHLEKPASVTDRTDGKIVHLDGLNLSRAWCFYGIANILPEGKYKQHLIDVANAHVEVTLPNIADGNYEGEHWLASFAVYTLSVR